MQADFFRDWNLEQDEMVRLIVKGLRQSPYQIVGALTEFQMLMP